MGIIDSAFDVFVLWIFLIIILMFPLAKVFRIFPKLSKLKKVFTIAAFVLFIAAFLGVAIYLFSDIEKERLNKISAEIEQCERVLKESTTKEITDFSLCDDENFRKLFLKDSEKRNKLFDLLKTENK